MDSRGGGRSDVNASANREIVRRQRHGILLHVPPRQAAQHPSRGPADLFAVLGTVSDFKTPNSVLNGRILACGSLRMKHSEAGNPCLVATELPDDDRQHMVDALIAETLSRSMTPSNT